MTVQVISDFVFELWFGLIGTFLWCVHLTKLVMTRKQFGKFTFLTMLSLRVRCVLQVVVLRFVVALCACRCLVSFLVVCCWSYLGLSSLVLGIGKVGRKVPFSASLRP